MLRSILKLSLFFVLPCLFHGVSAQEVTTEDTTYILDIDWNPDGTQLAVVGVYPGTTTVQSNIPSNAHGYLSVINSLNGSPIFITQPDSAFTSVAWSPDGERLALGSFDGTVWIVDALTGERITNLFGHQATVTDVDWNDDGTQIISSGSWDTLLILWDATDYTLLSQWETPAHPNAIEFGTDDRTITVGTEGGLYMFSVDTESTSLISPNNRIIREWVLDFTYSHDRRYIASGSIAHVNSRGVRDDAHIVIFDLSTQTILHQFESSLGSIGGITWSTDDQYLAVLNEDSVMTLWDIESGIIIATYPSFGNGRYNKGGVAYSLYGGRLAFSNWLNPDTSQLQSSSEEVKVLGDGAVQMIVPEPSLERLNAIADLCIPPNSTRSITVAANVEAIPDFITQIEALADEEIPAGCRADLLAVAEALIEEK